jgi:hypothetical protein
MQRHMATYSIKATVSDTELEGRIHTIRAHCRDGSPVELRREKGNPHNPYAIAVWVEYGAFFSLFKIHRQIGYIRTGWAKDFALSLDSGEVDIRRAYISRVHAPQGADCARVSLVIDCARVKPTAEVIPIDRKEIRRPSHDAAIAPRMHQRARELA